MWIKQRTFGTFPKIFRRPFLAFQMTPLSRFSVALKSSFKSGFVDCHKDRSESLPEKEKKAPNLRSQKLSNDFQKGPPKSKWRKRKHNSLLPILKAFLIFSQTLWKERERKREKKSRYRKLFWKAKEKIAFKLSYFFQFSISSEYADTGEEEEDIWEVQEVAGCFFPSLFQLLRVPFHYSSASNLAGYFSWGTTKKEKKLNKNIKTQTNNSNQRSCADLTWYQEYFWP